MIQKLETDSYEAIFAKAKRSVAADIGTLPEIKDKRRRGRHKKRLDSFLRCYFPHLFFRPFSKDQLKAIRKIERACLKGGQFAVAMPRGTGKTTITEGAMIWASLYGHRRYLVVIAADKGASNSVIADIKAEIETNDMLCDDFPEVCVAVRHIDGRAQRAGGQTHEGTRTRIEWKVDYLTYPTIAGSVSSGTIMEGRGITSGVRGMKKGELRPDFVMIDDPQTRESAESETQTNQRERIIKGDVMGLAGHDKEIAAVMPCTVIQDNDLADRHLDTKAHPEWQGHRSPLVYSWSTSESLWKAYHDLWKEGQEAGEGIAAATAFYTANRKAMDEGAEVACPNMYAPDTEASAIQHAYNLYYKVGESAFAAEYQNQPEEGVASVYDITPKLVASRINGMRAWEIPEAANIVTGFADLNYVGLHWVVAGFENDFSGYVAASGKYPKGAKVLCQKNTPNPEALFFKALTEMMDMIAAADLRRGGEKVELDMFMIDCGRWMDMVFKWIRMKGRKYPFKIIASRGWAASRYKQTAPEGRPGDGYHRTTFKGKGKVISHNADLWRMRMQKSFLLDVGASGGTSLWGDSEPKQMYFAEHICGEKLTHYVEDRGVAIYQWAPVVGRANDLGDSMTGAMVAAAEMGASYTPAPKRKKKKKKRARMGTLKI